ncbi:multidrug transporter [Natrinema gelatinilyticum]|uniref:multidrug transporter n=1 Tax=Natrinema gelatinilyticum TaxID=2961571 RepID=UPI0020C350BD|nr:multidrug transporter [Natrinema gelatinilyticum]
MSASLGRSSSPLVTAIGVAFAFVAIVGTRFLGWEWGSGQLVPTILGVVAAILAVFVIRTRRG